MYKGLSASYLGVTEGTIQWVLYERLKKLTGGDGAVDQFGEARNGFQQWLGMMGSAGGAKMAASLITYPHEVSFHEATSVSMRTRLSFLSLRFYGRVCDNQQTRSPAKCDILDYFKRSVSLSPRKALARSTEVFPRISFAWCQMPQSCIPFTKVSCVGNIRFRILYITLHALSNLVVIATHRNASTPSHCCNLLYYSPIHVSQSMQFPVIRANTAIHQDARHPPEKWIEEVEWM